MYIIVAWYNVYNADVLTDEFGENLTFVDFNNATRYAEKNCKHYQVISI